MKVLYAITLAEHGGAQSHVAELLRGFSNQAELSLCIGENGFLSNLATNLRIPCYVIPELVRPIQPLADYRATRSLYGLMKRLKPDLVHTHTAKAGLLARAAARMAGIPVVYTPHGWAFSERSSVSLKLIARVCERVSTSWTSNIVAVSQAEHDLAIRFRVAPDYKVTTIPHGIPDVQRRFKPAAGPEVVLLMVARFATPKNHALLVEALSGTPAHIKLILAGDGPLLPLIRKKVVSLGLTHRVSFLGAIDNVSQLLERVRIALLVSESEAFSLSVLEAMRAGLPVIASAVGGIPELVEDGSTGFLVPRGNVLALRRTIIQLAGDFELQRRFGQAGRMRFETHFRLCDMLEKTWSVYVAAISSHRTRKVA